MPTPRKGEKESDFVGRCIPVVQQEEPGKSRSAAAAKCHGIYRQSKKRK